MSQEQKINYEAVLADLERQRDAIDNVIKALRMTMSAGMKSARDAAAEGRPIDPLDIPNDAFFGLSITEAVKKYLSIVKRKQTIKEITDALERGGLPHSSTNFIDTVRAMVNRQARTDPELVRVGPGNWGLSIWYGNRRPKQEPTVRTKRRGRQRKAKTIKESKASAAVESTEKPRLTVAQQAEQVLRAAGGTLNIDALLGMIEKTYSRKVAKTTLVGILSEKVRKQQMFTRPAPNTYGLIGSSGTLH